MNTKIEAILAQMSQLPNFFHGIPSSEDQIRKLESTLGIEVPDDFRRFLQAYGCAQWDGRMLCGIGSLVGKSTPGLTTDCGRLTEYERSPNPGYPRGALRYDGLAISTDGAGGIFVLWCNGDKKSSRVSWLDPVCEVSQWESLAEFLVYFADFEPKVV